ncbi:Pyruvate phosphate dikinase, PEP/pyruvate binding domain [Flavobacteriaceae bacterium MAR_2010_188]|nr:Pyruvate phosphate dikinase, PEP/pyruvate binding domain [Flavobacteriaceae bacterium MAR_2010_188]
MSQLNKFLILLSVGFLFSTNSFSQELPVATIKQRIEQYKNDVRGPYYRIKWFCEDGSIRDSKDPCPDDTGGGIQHASLKDEVIQMGEKYHLYFADILASVDADDFWDANNNHSRLKQYQLGKYLMSVDDGWVLRKGQFYRGAIQSEDEEAWGIKFYEKLLKNDERLTENYYLIRQSLRDIPHNGDDNLSQRLRSESKVIADEYAPFMDIRVKIHSQPDAGDIKLVNDFYAKNQSKLSPAINKEFSKLKSTLQEYYQPIDFKTLQAEAKTIKDDNETLKELNQLLNTYSDDAPKDVIVSNIADILYKIRLGITDFKSPSDRLTLLDLSLKLEDVLLRKANEWETSSLKEQLEKISTLSCATVGTGLIEIWEYQTVDEKLNLALGKKNIDLADLNSILESSRGLVEWSTSLVKGNYQDIVDTYNQFEPKSYGFIDDRIRSSVALVLGDAVSELGAFIADESSMTNKVMTIGQQSSIRGLNPGYAKGKLIVVPGNSNDVEVSPENIYVFQKPPSDLKPVAGIMTVSEGNLVSHVQLLARNLGIPNAALSGTNLSELERFNGQEIFYAVSNKGSVIMKSASSMSKEEEALFSVEKKAKNMITVPVENIRLDQKDILYMRNVDAKDSGKLCGPKAANLGQLKSMFPDYVVEGLVIPFGIFKAHMDMEMPNENKTYWQYLNETFANAKSMKGSGKSSAEVEEYQLGRLSVLRDAINAMNLDKNFVSQLKNQFKEVFGDKIGDVPVFLRSDTNMEDLKEFTGAGLNLTLFNILEEDKIIEGIKKVWASPYTERSFKWRQQYLLNPENVFPSILIIPSVDVDYSGVMITTGINSGNADDLTVAFSRGAGGAVDGQSAETHLISKKDDIILSPAREGDYIRLPKEGGTSHHFTTFSKPILNKKNIDDIRKIAAEIIETLPKKTGSDYKGAYDVELGFKDDKLWLFQIRPFVENSNAKSSDYLTSISPKIDYKKDISLSKKL